MFDFLFKRSTGNASETGVADKSSAVNDRAEASRLAKQEAMDRADAMCGNEAEAVEFVLQCQFADARLKAASHISSRSQLERVQQAMRNADRRVSKLMQTKLDVLVRQEINAHSATHCIQQAQSLLEATQLAPNQVADLDRLWTAVGQAPEILQIQFDNVRALLRKRLEDQAALQRSVIDVLTNLNKIIGSSEVVAPAESERALALLTKAMTQHASATEATSLPKHLLSEFTQKHRDFKQRLELLKQHAAVITIRQEALLRWESDDVGAISAEVIKREWRALPALQNEEILAPLQERYDHIIRKMTDAKKPSKDMSQEAKQDGQQHFAEWLSELESALQEGALQTASEVDKRLRTIDLKMHRLSESQSAHLAKVRAELHRLQGWAKWGGNVSREELLKAAEGLPGQSLGALELAKKVGSLRERWKSLDISAGPASTELWHRFDAACTTAYAPAAAHFKRLAEERHLHGEKARAIIAEVRQFAANLDFGAADGSVDWKALAAFCSKASQTWRKLGAIDRKDKKQLDAEFHSAMQMLLGPLAQQQAMELKRREKLIDEAACLNPNERGALDNLRSLQERWQVQAKSLPLEHRDEQALWQRFRDACDLAFAKRKAIADAADAERKQNLQAKQLLCDALEAVRAPEIKEFAKVLRESKEAWSKIGSVPRAAEEKIETRFKHAVRNLEKKRDEGKKAAAQAEFMALQDKLRLCRSVELALVNHAAIEESTTQTFESDWERLPVTRAEFERKLNDRFLKSLEALKTNDKQYANSLQNNALSVAKEVLHCEILTGIASPAELAQERLQLQVEVLQSSLKTGAQAMSPEFLSSRLSNLCGMPAVSNPQVAARLDQLIAHLKDTAI